jgi:S-DNA-T family DNA segregation ATPase FtsK/SpoIIIE
MLIILHSRFATSFWGTAIALTFAWYLLTPILVYVVVSGSLIGLVAWSMHGGEMFRQQVVYRPKSWYRSIFIYRIRWRGRLEECHVILKDGNPKVPAPLSCKSKKSTDEVEAWNPPGVTIQNWRENAADLAAAFHAQRLAVYPIDKKVKDGPVGVDVEPRRVRLLFIVREPLIKPVEPFQYPTEPIPQSGWALSLKDDFTPWLVHPLWRHWLFVGVTGSGKSSGGWCYVYMAIPAIQAGLMKITGLDPKGGAELGMGAHVFSDFVFGDLKNDPSRYEWPFVHALEDKVAILNRRLDEMRGESRKHIPTVGSPAEVIFCDEMASLTAWCQNREAKKRMQNAMAHIISKGRAANVLFLGMSQEATKDILPMRDLIPYRVAFRLRTRQQVNMVLGDGMWYRGALCDEIPDVLPGIAYAVMEGSAMPFRMRFPFITDDMIRAMPPCPEKAPNGLQLYTDDSLEFPIQGGERVPVLSGPVVDTPVRVTDHDIITGPTSVPVRLRSRGMM